MITRKICAMMLLLAAALVVSAGPTTAGKARGMDTKRLARVAQPGGTETQLTHGKCNHWMMPFAPFSPDCRWIVYDTRVDDVAMGSNGAIFKVETRTGEIVRVYRAPQQARNGPGCGTASFSPDGRVVFIHGVPGLPYEITRRVAMEVDDGHTRFLDARDVTPPFTPGALRGGTHAHMWSGDSHWIGFTYNDQLMAARGNDLRTVGVMTDSKPVARLLPVKVNHDTAGENINGEWFTVVIARVTPEPRPGSDEISRAFENAWVGRKGYLKEDGSRQRAQTFIGATRDDKGCEVDEVFIADIPDRIDIPGPTRPLEGTTSDFPQPPAGVTQRRLTRMTNWRHPGVVTDPRHWLAPSPDGRFIAFLARDDAGVTQVFLVRPQGGEPLELTHNVSGVTTTISWSPDSTRVAYAIKGSLFEERVSKEGSLVGNDLLTRQSDNPIYYPAWSPSGREIAFVREIGLFRQIFLLKLKK